MALPRGEGFNVLFISIDTLRADHLGCYGHPSIKTPNIDRLAAEGVLFAQCTSPVPITLPSHASMMTGTYPYVHGARNNGRFLVQADNETLAEHLKAAGYATAAEVAAFVLNRDYGLHQGFDVYHDLHALRQASEDPTQRTPTERVADDVCDGAIKLLRELAPRKFFLFVHFFDPHVPYAAPPQFAQQYSHPYLGEIAYVDEQIGRLLAALAALELERKTLVIVTSDHGEGLGEHGEATHSVYLYNTTLRVPLIMRCPGQMPPGRRGAALVRIIDIAPTILAFLGCKPMPQAQGQSLLPLIEGQVDDLGLPAYAESLVPLIDYGYAPLRAIRAGGWKYIHAPRPELYQVSRDPAELLSLASIEPERVTRMRRQLYELIEQAPTVVDARATHRALNPDERRQLEAIGYLAGDPQATEVGGMTERELLDVGGDDPKDYVEEVRLLMHVVGLQAAGDLEAADKMLREFFTKSPERAEQQWRAQVLLAAILAEQGRRPEAIERYRIALRLYPDGGDAWGLLGELLTDEGRTDEALEAFGKATALEPVLARTHRSYSKLLRELGKPAEAMRQYRLGLEKDSGFRAMLQAKPQAVPTFYASGIRLLKQHEYAGAVETLRVARILDPTNLSLANDLAWILATCPDDAVRDGSQAVCLAEMVRRSAEKENPAWLDTLGAAYAASGRFEDALATVDRVVELARQRGDDELLNKAQERRKLYEAHQPYLDR